MESSIVCTISDFLSHSTWSVNYMSRVSKFHNFFLTCSETEARCIFEGFYYCHLWKVQFQLSRTFFSFFSSFFHHEFIFESFQYCYLSKVRFILFVPNQTFFWSANCTILVRKLHLLFQTILNLWPLLILEIFSYWDIKNCQFQFLVTFSVVFFWCVNCRNQVCISPHTSNIGNIFFEGFQYQVFQFLAFLIILSLLFVAIFSCLEMLKFWSVNYICQAWKSYFYFGHVRNFGQHLYLSVLNKQ